MSDTSAIQKIISDITQIQNEHGREQIAISPLLDYLNQIKGIANQSDIERDRAHQTALKALDAQSQSDIEMFKSVIDAGKETLRACLIVNGGAVVSLLALLGSLENSTFLKISGDISFALYLFSCATLCVLLSFASRYLSQFHYAHNEAKKWGNIYLFVSLGTCTINIFLFIGGIIYTHQAFNQSL